MKKTITLIVLIIAIIASILYLQRPEMIVEEETGEEIILGTLGPRVAADEGNTVQDFILVDYDGNTTQLSDYRGKYVILNFWATWCSFCIAEMPLFQSVYDDFKQRGGEIIAVNRAESLELARKFTDPMNLTYVLLLNKSDDIYNAYNLQAMPTTFFIDRKGVIQDIKFGPLQESEIEDRINSLIGTTEEDEDSDMGEYVPMDEEETEEMSEVIDSEESKIVLDDTKERPGSAQTRRDERVEEVLTDFEDMPTKDESEKEEPASLSSKRPISETKGVKHSVSLDDIHGGGPPKDGIPSIDNPKFTSVEEANEFLNDEGLGIAVSFNGVDRFYSNQITVWHEIVNDNIGGQPALVTYCPLCGTGIVFEPIVQGEAVEFGTSGKLWNSNLVMYDRKTDSYWSQVLGEAIVGEMTGARLKLLPHDNIKWKDWKKEHPDGEVLSKETGYFRNYVSGGPYGDYDTSRRIAFPVDNTDDRFHPKEPSWGIIIGDEQKVYTKSELEKGSGQFSDELDGVPLQVKFDDSENTIKIINSDTEEEVVPFFGFWFSWISVWPDSEVYIAE